MKKKLLATLVLATALLVGCGQSTEEQVSPIQTVAQEPITAGENGEKETEVVAEETTEAIEEENHDGMYRSELTNEWIDESLKDQRPIAVMVDNEKTALPHYGLNDADIIYELMNSTMNDRVSRFMVVYKDWANITQLGSIRSARTTNFVLAPEYNAVLIHDGGPYYINIYAQQSWSNNFSGGFARFSNGKATEFTEYVTYDSYTNSKKGQTYDGLKQRFANSNYTTTYNSYYPGEHWIFAEETVTFENRSDAKDAVTIELPFYHNSSTLKYNEETGTYDYYEYGSAHKDALTNEVLTFENVILQDTTFTKLDDNGYLTYNVMDSGRSGYYITEGKAIAITWSKASETAVTHYYDKSTGSEIEINTGKTYVALVPSDTWSEVVISAK